MLRSPRRPRIRASLAGALPAALLVIACGKEPEPLFPLAAPAAPGTCTEWRGQPVDRTCVPRVARAGEPLVLEVEERCGACSTVERCTVDVDGRTVTLSLDGRACEPPPGASCPEACGKSRIRCQVPPLLEGKYTIRYGDTSGRVDVLEVAETPDAATTCVLDETSRGG